MKQSLYEMAKGYDDAIEQLELSLAKAKIKFRKAKLELKEDECQKLLRLIEIYREELRDMKIVSDTLKHYYDRDVDVRRPAI